MKWQHEWHFRGYNNTSDEGIISDVTGFHYEKILDKQSLTGCGHPESHLNEERNDVFTLNGRIKGKFISNNIF